MIHRCGQSGLPSVADGGTSPSAAVALQYSIGTIM